MKTKTEKHTAGAIRAASAILIAINRRHGEFQPEEVARIIEHETALPALLAACKAAELARQSLARNAVFIRSALKSQGFDPSWLEGTLRNLEHSKSAIAAAEGGE